MRTTGVNRSRKANSWAVSIISVIDKDRKLNSSFYSMKYSWHKYIQTDMTSLRNYSCKHVTASVASDPQCEPQQTCVSKAGQVCLDFDPGAWSWGFLSSAGERESSDYVKPVELFRMHSLQGEVWAGAQGLLGRCWDSGAVTRC